ncbi:MAG: PEP-CTERM sorting domain-containing protein [Phycisphaerales bacterium]
MNRILAVVLAGAACASGAQAVVVNVDTSGGGWQGFMNVFNLPSAGGGYVFGSGWGIPDLCANFNDGAHTLTLTPNTIGDPDPFWYTPAGGPGATGNKIMEANLYHEVTTTLSGTTVNFKGTVLSNTLDPSHVASLFIRDFAADYSSSVDIFIPMVAGDFDFSLNTIPLAGRHVQWGMRVVGPDVWITDVGQYGTAVLATVPAPASLGLIGLGGLAMARRRRA